MWQGMETDETTHRARVTGGLHLAGLDPTITRHEILQGGISGAATYRVGLPNEHVVLKVTEADDSYYLVERAQREMGFYRELADRIPLAVPKVRGLSRDASTRVICLRAYDPAPPIDAWTEGDYLEVATQLGRFHALFWDDVQRLAHLLWLRRERWPADPAQAAAIWRVLLEEPVRQKLLPSSEPAWIEAMLARVEHLEAVIEALPPTLCHGDCHYGNLLQDGSGRWIWADWQEVGIGWGAEDLSFFLQRARFAGGSVPQQAVMATYHQALEEATERRIPFGEVPRAVDASELRMALLLWPPFLSQLSPQRLAAFVERLHGLADGLGGDV
jgi:Ser/Thr protein kinase RdoA (MazF antagonist)